MVLAQTPLGRAAKTAAALDALYPREFRLRPLAADAIPVVQRPIVRAPSLSAPSYIDSVYGTRIYRATDPSDFPGAEFVRHEYSRRQAFNADNSRYLAQSSNGNWLLYDANGFSPLRRAGHNGALKGMAGDAEPIWHPDDPTRLWYTSTNGGLVWWEKSVESDVDSVMVDFRGRLPWPAATAVWTKGEGTCSANGRLFGFMATSYDERTKESKIHGMIAYDRLENRIVGTLDAATFGRAMPDHISVSPSGSYVVPCWAYSPALGARAYTPDFRSFRLLHPDCEHSDLALGARGEDLYVAASYKDGVVYAKNLSSGDSYPLLRLYPRRAASIGAVHVCGQAFGRPGWVLISTYADSADYGRTKPDPVLHAAHRKIFLVELKPNGRQLSVAHTQSGADYGGYPGEHQATISRDGSRILFASNFHKGPPSSYMIGLPSWVYD